MRSGLISLWLVGCAATAPLPTTPETDVAESEPEESPDPASIAVATTELRQRGVAIGWFESQDRVEVVGQDGVDAIVELPFFRREGSRGVAIRAHVTSRALQEPRIPESDVELIRTAVHHEITLEHEDGAVIAEVRCGEIEILEGSDRARSRVRVRREGVVLEGWVAGELAPRGTADCPPRVISGPRQGVATLNGERIEPDPLPTGYREVQDVAIRRTGSVWWLIPSEHPTCERWRWSRNGTRLQNRTSEQLTTYSVEGEGAQLVLLGPSWESLSPNGSSGAFGCANLLTVVDADRDRWVVVAAEQVRAYHEDDVEHWYLNARACEQAREELLGARHGC